MTTVASEAPRWLVEPFVMGTAEQFQRLREFFERINFTERGICERAGIQSVYEVPPPSDQTSPFRDIVDPLSVAVRLLINSTLIPWSAVRAHWSERDVELLEDFGLIRSALNDGSLCLATVALYPNGGLYIASDRHEAIDATATGTPADVVYSALTLETRRFLEYMPRAECNDYLELCSGTGIAALTAARDFARRAWAIDITERSTRFARFNAALNGITNVTPLEGDLYGPVAGQTFDLITAHPPYMPSFETEMVFRDGGEDGEQITRRILGGLAEHLRPGGQFYCDCMMSDRANAPLETRVREMLGSEQGEFDIVLAQVGTLDPLEYYADRLASARITAETFARRQALFKSLGLERFIHAAILIQRRKEKRTVVTRRRITSVMTTSSDFQRYLRWATLTSDWEKGSDRYLDARPRRSPETELQTRSVFRDGRWAVAQTSLVTLAPFAAEAPCAPWFATLLSWCDGRATAREHFVRLRDTGLLPEAATERDFAVLTGELADGGFIELDVSPPPVQDVRA